MPSVAEIKRNREKWLKELKSTTLPQGRGKLGDEIFGFCCLGLGCHILGVKYDRMAGASKEFKECVGLRHHLGKPKDFPKFGALADLNDSNLLPFSVIAEHLRENMDQYFKEDTL